MRPTPDRGRGPSRGPRRSYNDRTAGPRSQRRERAPAPSIRVIRDEHDFIAIEKPAGLLTQRPRSEDPRNDGPRGHGFRPGKPTAFDQLLDMIRDREGRRAQLIPVQNLDRDASGIVVFARTPAAAIKLGEAFRTRRATRVYSALVCGTPDLRGPADGNGASPADAATQSPDAEENAGDGIETRADLNTDASEADTSDQTIGTIQTLLAQGSRGLAEVIPIGARFEDGVPGDADNHAVRAVTHFRVSKKGPACSLLRIRAETDYPFQVRAHLASVGSPVAGDRPYKAPHDPIDRLALHLGEVSFQHPASNETIRLTLKPPPEIASAVDHNPAMPAPDSGWDEVADWYTDLLDRKASDLHEHVVWPRTMALLDVQPGERVLDIACGPGDLAVHVHRAGGVCTGIDASPRLVDAASHRAPEGAAFTVADAADLPSHRETIGDGFDAATCVLALMNIDAFDTVFRGAADLLRPGGRLVCVLLHPAFRSPRQTSWLFTETPAGEPLQARRVDVYLSHASHEIVMNPGATSDGAERVTTTTHHRPICAYVNAAASAGLAVDALEEWPSHRVSDSGPRAAAENHARAEIPMFLAFRCRKHA